MNDELKRAFVDETGETLTALNNELLDLETTPNDQSTIDAIFRRAHTLKGNLGAMGLTEAASLAHEMEDLLDEIRDGTVGVDHEVMDALFDSVDGLEAVVAGIEQDEPPEVALESIVASLESIGDDTTDQAANTSDESDQVANGGSIHLQVVHGEMPGADAAILLERLDQAVDDYDTEPSRAAMLDGNYGEVIGIDTADPDAVESAVDGLRMVESVVRPEKAPPTEEDSKESNASTDLGVSSEIRSIRIDAERLDSLHGLVETLVTARIGIDRGIRNQDLDAAEESLKTVDKALGELQDEVMDMRLIPLETIFSSLPRLVRDTSRETGKEIDFSIEGADIELDRTIVNRLDDPLVHLLRNAIDHGIEPPEAREAAGKDPTGEILIKADRDRDTVVIEIIDDGGGIDPAVIKEKAIERSVRPRELLESMAAEDLYQLIFEPGFSTAEEVTDVSGRGVGMDAVKTVINELDGSININSELGEGTTVTLRLPVDIAIDDVLFVVANGQTVGIPVRTIADIEADRRIDLVHGEPMVDPGDGFIPVVDLGDALTTATTDGGTTDSVAEMLVRIRPEERPIALACEDVSEQEEVVIRPLEGILSDIQGLSGTTVLGGGTVVPIIDIHTL